MQILSEQGLGHQKSMALYIFPHEDSNAIDSEGCQHIAQKQWSQRLELLCLSNYFNTLDGTTSIRAFFCDELKQTTTPSELRAAGRWQAQPGHLSGNSTSVYVSKVRIL